MTRPAVIQESHPLSIADDLARKGEAPCTISRTRRRNKRLSARAPVTLRWCGQFEIVHFSPATVVYVSELGLGIRLSEPIAQQTYVFLGVPGKDGPGLA